MAKEYPAADCVDRKSNSCRTLAGCVELTAGHALVWIATSFACGCSCTRSVRSTQPSPSHHLSRGEAGGSKQGGREGEGEGEGEGRINGCRSDDEGGVGGGDEEGLEEEGLSSSSDDDTDGIVDMEVRGKRTRTRNHLVFEQNSLWDLQEVSI